MPSFQWDIRPLNKADTSAIVALYDRAASTDIGIGPVTQADWDRFIAMPQNLTGRDFRVALAEGTLVGLAQSSPRDRTDGKARFFKIVVDPAWRLRGLGMALLSELLALDGDPNAELHTLVRPDWAAGVAFLAAFGFAVVEEEIAMRLGAPSVTAWTAPQISFERLEDVGPVADGLAHIHNMAYARDAGFRAHTADEIAVLLADADVWVAREYGHVIGFCLAEPEATSVWIESVAIDPARQGRGVGSALLRHVLVAERIGFGRPAALQVSSLNSVARRAYKRLGFVETSRQVRFAARRNEVIAQLR
jgi:ribosomal protein S18 acetylase RimI-like enzyme